ncbi:SRPBCC family protein [Chromobacterium subtsugae]|uniref:SRPBCC family protein n=1 Tax=Chromobacterium subtsugae TaxID=251747 RepID=UPI000AFA4070|nr:SRPBCC family protein [Chromobacterium subtsugae]
MMSLFTASREIAAGVDQVFAAISAPERLARWWGPDGFSNRFETCDFRPGGRWVFTMHGPDGKHYPNENVFVEIDAPRKVVVEHVGQPKYRLTLTLTPTPAGTRVNWAQQFESAELAERMAPIVIPANEQNLDRLQAEVLRS